MNSFLEFPIFVCGHRKSGTTMLINMLDGVKNSVTYPDDSSFFYLYYPRYEIGEHTKEQKIERVCDMIIQHGLSEIIQNAGIEDLMKQDLLEKVHTMGDAVRNDLNKLSDMCLKEVMKIVFTNLKNIFYPSVLPKCWIEKTTSTEIYAQDLIKIFPNAKFIHIIRDPKDNWASLKSGWEKRYQDFNDDIKRLMHSLLERGKLGMEFAKYNQELIGDSQYLVLKYEDFTREPEAYMRKISGFIGVEFDEKMLTPTVFGHPWKGNNFEGIKFEGASSVNVGRWRERIEEGDAMLIEYHFKELMDYFGYKRSFHIKDTQNAAKEHYKWHNFTQIYGAK